MSTKLELLEVCHPTVPFEARLEIVLTEDDPSFLAYIHHRTLISKGHTSGQAPDTSEFTQSNVPATNERKELQ